MSRLKKIGGRIQERNLARLVSNLDHAEGSGEIVAPVVSGNSLMRVGPGKYNPPFKAQIQIQVLKYYFTEAAGVYTEVLAAALHATLQVDLPVFMFANADFDSGYAKLRAQYPLSGWTYQSPVRYGKDYPATQSLGVWDSVVTAKLQNGDIVLPVTALAVGGNDYLGITVIRTSDVPYASLLASTNSNTFNINLIRYTVTAGQEVQYANAILITNETMFGKFTSDPINPEAFKNPEQQQDNIIDMDIEVDINKQKGLALMAGYDIVTFRFNLFIANATKIV